MESPTDRMTFGAPPTGAENDQGKFYRSTACSLDLAEALLKRGEISECVVALRAIDEEMIASRLLSRYNYLILATAIFGAETQSAAMKILQSPEIFSTPALGYRFALQTGSIGRAKEIRASRKHLHAEFGWSASLRCLWDGKLKQGLKLYPHRHGAVNFGSFLPEGAVYQTLGSGAGDEIDAMFLEQGVGDVLLHLALMATVRCVPPKLIVGPPQLRTFVKRFFKSVEFRPSGVVYDDLKGAKMHASGDYLAVAQNEMNGLKPAPFLSKARRPLFPKIGVCWRGGSAQNRREQRRYNLEHFLDLLPIGPSYVALQPDLLDEECRLLLETGRVQTPDFDIRSDIEGLFDMISGLAGVICVDSANLHLAGLANVPAYVLMNAKKHWYWGTNGNVSDVYPSASAIPRHLASKADLQGWISQCQAGLPTRGPAFVKQLNADGPILITGIPRSGTSMISNCLQQAGLWLGATIQPNGDNPRGFFENREIRERILKPNLKVVGADPLGVLRLPDLAALAPDPKLRERVLAIFSQQGHDGQSRWGYKEPKLSLSWPLWAEAFPDATWVIVERDIEAVVKSCLNTNFMNRHSCDAEFWRTFASRYRERLDNLADTVPNVVRISSDDVIAGDYTALTKLAARLDLDWTQSCVAQIVPGLFNRVHRS